MAAVPRQTMSFEAFNFFPRAKEPRICVCVCVHALCMKRGARKREIPFVIRGGECVFHDADIGAHSMASAAVAHSFGTGSSLCCARKSPPSITHSERTHIALLDILSNTFIR